MVYKDSGTLELNLFIFKLQPQQNSMSGNESSTYQLAKALMRQPSITPDDAGCQAIIKKRLDALGFTLQSLPFGAVSNLWARLGTTKPLFVFAGHTDVVPPGPLDAWKFPPFQPTAHQGCLYGRGAVDMKGSLAAMITACETFLSKRSQPARGSIGFLITSDEEGEATCGTAKVIDYLTAQQETIDYCLVGEPSSAKQLGDTLRIGRRGSLNALLTVHGKQGHTAFPALAKNPIHAIAPFIASMQKTHWDTDERPAHYPPTTLQMSNITAGTGATNVIPGSLKLSFNLRFAPPLTPEHLKATIHTQLHYLKDMGFNYDIHWQRPAYPFYTQQGKLISACTHAIEQHTGKTPTQSTGGGTSDGRFIATTGCEVVEFGLCNRTIHQVDEHVSIDDLTALSAIYTEILTLILA